jgi:hypothetical protein
VGTQRKLDYWRPVKVQRLPDGRAMVTEYDGDQFVVRADGSKVTPISGSGRHGALAVDAMTDKLIPASAPFNTAQGTALSYYGRGYCQITWWTTTRRRGTGSAGSWISFDPELVLDHQVAYEIMSTRTGRIFAHGMNIGRFICGGHCDYKNARQMVNGEGGPQLAAFAEQFERILLAAKASDGMLA